MNKIGIYLMFSMMLGSFMANAQYAVQDEVIILGDPRIGQLVDLHVAYNKEFQVMDGFRIQLMMKAGNSALDEANETKEAFEKQYPQVHTYITFREPYYLLRVGDFRTRLEAIEFLEGIKNNYPQAWITKDKIEFPELKNYTKTDNYE